MQRALTTTLLNLGNFLHELRNVQTAVRMNLEFLDRERLGPDESGAVNDALHAARSEQAFYTGGADAESEGLFDVVRSELVGSIESIKRRKLENSSLPATVTAGDLLLVFISVSSSTEIQTFYVPDGWVEVANDSPTFTSKRVMAKVAIGNEDGDLLKFAETVLGTPCVDIDTEIFTERGWLRYDEVNGTDKTKAIDPDTGNVVWTSVTQVRRFNGRHEVFRFTGDVDAVTTVDHNWLVRRDDEWLLTNTLRLRFDDEVCTENGLVPVRDLRFEQDVIEGMVWCPTTELGNWLARRNGTVYYTGNKP
jgi:hypothetical protein